MNKFVDGQTRAALQRQVVRRRPSLRQGLQRHQWRCCPIDKR